ncbi:hypothetical protein HTZ77_21090 [Nonomuraea sp. SMC257]|uniref:Uncharacterized protein n=1 Tax=Nonomuraea montanisoli TaxID=2741721 RepID=A0A7Y6IA34_9ACTN|nr:hypothetical protein [Nonomuraea montanisoli]NUW33908.1 hypothetical protein [Nonomuraea montanisoli]
MRTTKPHVAAGRGALVGTVVGAAEAAIWAIGSQNEGIALLAMMAMWIVPLPLGALLASRAGLPRWGVAAVAGPSAFAFVARALNALVPHPSLTDVPMAAYGFPFVLAAAVSYAAAAWAASHGPSWPARTAAAVAICAFVVVALQGRGAVADWHKERALRALDIPLLALDLPGYRLTSSDVVRLPDGVRLDLSYRRGDAMKTVTLRPGSRGTPQEWCAKQEHDAIVPGAACRALPGGRLILVEGDGATSLFARDRGALVTVMGDSEAEARDIAAHLRPASPASLARLG